MLKISILHSILLFTGGRFSIQIATDVCKTWRRYLLLDSNSNANNSKQQQQQIMRFWNTMYYLEFPYAKYIEKFQQIPKDKCKLYRDFVQTRVHYMKAIWYFGRKVGLSDIFLEEFTCTSQVTDPRVALFGHALVAVPVSVDNDSDKCIPIGNSKIGGCPDLPPYYGIDTHNLDFLMQINLKHASFFTEFSSLFPQEGMLYVFLPATRIDNNDDTQYLRYLSPSDIESNGGLQRRKIVKRGHCLMEPGEDYLIEPHILDFRYAFEMPSSILSKDLRLLGLRTLLPYIHRRESYSNLVQDKRLYFRNEPEAADERSFLGRYFKLKTHLKHAKFHSSQESRMFPLAFPSETGGNTSSDEESDGSDCQAITFYGEDIDVPKLPADDYFFTDSQFHNMKILSLSDIWNGETPYTMESLIKDYNAQNPTKQCHIGFCFVWDNNEETDYDDDTDSLDSIAENETFPIPLEEEMIIQNTIDEQMEQLSVHSDAPPLPPPPEDLFIDSPTTHVNKATKSNRWIYIKKRDMEVMYHNSQAPLKHLFSFPFDTTSSYRFKICDNEYNLVNEQDFQPEQYILLMNQSTFDQLEHIHQEYVAAYANEQVVEEVVSSALDNPFEPFVRCSEDEWNHDFKNILTIRSEQIGLSDHPVEWSFVARKKHLLDQSYNHVRLIVNELLQ
jgi:hypothetical protein